MRWLGCCDTRRCKKITKGKRIFEFNNKRFHRENSDIKPSVNPLIYKRYYPGYQDPSKHPDNLCIPCCFTTPSSKYYGEYTYDIDRDVFIDKNGKDV